MAKRNGYADRIMQAQERGFMTGQHFTRQLCMDIAAIVLNRLYGFGADRIERFNKEMVEQYGNYATTWNGDTKDVEYSKETMDRALQQIFGERFVPWDERYS